MMQKQWSGIVKYIGSLEIEKKGGLLKLISTVLQLQMESKLDQYSLFSLLIYLADLSLHPLSCLTYN